MMYNYPGFFPFRRYSNNYQNYVKSYPQYPYKNSTSYPQNYNSTTQTNLNNSSNITNSANKTQSQDISEENRNEVFEIFGIKLYFDDLLLICLIFFLYNEGVNDQYLFIALILLLLS